MVNFLESQIGLLERQTVSPDVQEVEDLIAFHLTALERLEIHLCPDGLSQADRELVPLFQRWLRAARNVKELARAHRDGGPPVGNYDDLPRAINRSKPIAEDFDH